MFKRPLPIAIVMAVLAGIPLFLLSSRGYQLNTENFPLIAVSVLAFFAITAFWSAMAARSGLDSGAGSGGMREIGTVKWFNVNKGFGFISREGGGDIFVHFRSIRGRGHRVLTEGQEVEFSVIMGEKGEQAHDVEVLR